MKTHFQEVTVSGRTVELTHRLYFLKMAIVSRKDVKDLDDQWKRPGIYVLADGWTNSWCAYIGKAKKLSVRVPNDRTFEWNRALIVRRSEPHDLDSAETGWLEGRIHELLKAAGVELKNERKPQDDTLSMDRQRTLENYVGVIQHALVLLGYDPAGQQQQAPAQTAELEAEDVRPATIGKTHRNVLDVVRAGTQIESTLRKHHATATVESTGIRYQGKLFTSLQAAAKDVTGYDKPDGWSSWGVRSDSGEVVSLKRLRAQTSNRTSTVRDAPRNARSAIDSDEQDRMQSPRRNAKNRTTPKKMSPAKVRRLLARKDEGATYGQLAKEFGLTKSSIYNLLLKNGRVRERG